MNPLEKYKEIRKESSLSQAKFAAMFGVKVHLIKELDLERQKSIPDELALALEAEYSIPFKWWKTGQGPMTLEASTQVIAKDENCIELPLIEVSCGGGITHLDNQVIMIDKKQLLDLGFKCFDKFIACRAVGDSMQPDINEDDLLIINTQFDIKDGRVYVINAHGELFCKKIRRGINYFIMESINKNYPEETFNRDEISAINVVGQVVTIIRKMRI